MSTTIYMLAWWGGMKTKKDKVVTRQGFTNFSRTLGLDDKGKNPGKLTTSTVAGHAAIHAKRGLSPACIVAVEFPNGAPAAGCFLTEAGRADVSTKSEPRSLVALVGKYGAKVSPVKGTGQMPPALTAALRDAKAEWAKANKTKTKPTTGRKTKPTVKAEAVAVVTDESIGNDDPRLAAALVNLGFADAVE